MLRVVTGVLIATLSVGAFAQEYYSAPIPQEGASSMYYALGGGNQIPDVPSTQDRVSVGFKGALGGIFSCGSGIFNPTAAITNSINGIKNSFQNMFNDAVSNATGALQQMPAYLIARANPSLYQLLQNGFQSGQFSFGMAVKSCSDVQNDIQNGKDPIDGFVHSSTRSDWQGSMMNSQSYGFQAGRLTYEASENTDINTAKDKVEKDNGKNGVPWVKGAQKGENYLAGGQGQPVIKLTYDVVLAGANAMVGKSTYSDSTPFGKTTALKNYWANSDEMAKWAVDVLGERVITTYQGGVKTATPGMGLLSKVQSQFTGDDGIWQKLNDLVSGKEELSVDNLKAVSTTSVVVNKAIITTLMHQDALKRAISLNVLAQGIATARVVDEAQMLMQVLQSAEQVPAIASNNAAQKQIQRYLSTLKDQINMVVSFKTTNQKLITQSIQTIVNDQEQSRQNALSNRPTATQSLVNPSEGVVTYGDK